MGAGRAVLGRPARQGAGAAPRRRARDEEAQRAAHQAARRGAQAGHPADHLGVEGRRRGLWQRRGDADADVPRAQRAVDPDVGSPAPARHQHREPRTGRHGLAELGRRLDQRDAAAVDRHPLARGAGAEARELEDRRRRSLHPHADAQLHARRPRAPAEAVGVGAQRRGPRACTAAAAGRGDPCARGRKGQRGVRACELRVPGHDHRRGTQPARRARRGGLRRRQAQRGAPLAPSTAAARADGDAPPGDAVRDARPRLRREHGRGDRRGTLRLRRGADAGVDLLTGATARLAPAALRRRHVAIIVWMGFWAYFEYKAFKAFLWRKYGVEKIKLHEGKLFYKRDVAGRGKVKVFDAEFIKDLRILEAKENSFLENVNNSYWVVGGEKIAFDHYGKEIKIGIQLEKQDADELIKLIKKKFSYKY